MTLYVRFRSVQWKRPHEYNSYETFDRIPDCLRNISVKPCKFRASIDISLYYVRRRCCKRTDNLSLPGFCEFLRKKQQVARTMCACAFATIIITIHFFDTALLFMSYFKINFKPIPLVRLSREFPRLGDKGSEAGPGSPVEMFEIKHLYLT